MNSQPVDSCLRLDNGIEKSMQIDDWKWAPVEWFDWYKGLKVRRRANPQVASRSEVKRLGGSEEPIVQLQSSFQPSKTPFDPLCHTPA